MLEKKDRKANIPPPPHQLNFPNFSNSPTIPIPLTISFPYFFQKENTIHHPQHPVPVY